ncbi:MAG: ATP-binding cassette domain-containing protein [Nitrososphaeria archaeon]|nr:ATP-binding cassette domain-containing protein [Aigarchaeota archaeon]MCX8187089.1 ATP-binding cassette domain-containing protein [Nitrososphaeria archaeon]MDW8021374.1 ATP-binding cassette domain-containing protein [Nitrososphaerota archaeon]
MKIIEIEDLSFKYSGSSSYALKNVNLSISEGEFVVLAGRSGCGKTTLLRCLNGLIPHFYEGEFSGSVRVNGMNTSETPPYILAQVVGMVFQNPDNQLFALTVEADIAFPLENLGLPREVIMERVEWALKTLNISDLRDRSPFELSGGQKQKVAIASVIAMKPKILLLDEPTSSLDPLSAKNLIDSILELNRRERLTIMISEHRLELLLPHAHRFIVMDRGEILYDGDPRVILKDDLLIYGIPTPRVSEVARHINASRHSLFTEIPLTVDEFVDELRRCLDDKARGC